MTSDPTLRAEVAALRAAAAASGESLATDDLRAEGWQRLSAALDAEGAAPPANDNRPLAWLKVAAVAVAAVVVWQVTAVPYLASREAGGFVPASVVSEAPILRIAFAGEAQADALTALLASVGARITDGPSANGLYTLAFADHAARDSAEEALAQRTDLVALVTRP